MRSKSKQGDQKLDPHPWGLSFCEWGWAVLLTRVSSLVMQNKSRKYRNMCFWLVKTSFTLVFMFDVPVLALCCKKPIQSSSLVSTGALNNDIGNFMVSHFYPIYSSTGWGKNGTSLKTIFLMGKSHWQKPLSFP